MVTETDSEKQRRGTVEAAQCSGGGDGQWPGSAAVRRLEECAGGTKKSLRVFLFTKLTYIYDAY